jgi:NAD(P)-dependent dehydrogenase (short-subunit alcohol dehydrogenase family)
MAAHALNARFAVPGSLEGRVIVIVGGTTGLGLSAARACAAAGARVVVTGRDAQGVRAAEAELAGAGRGLVGDAEDPASAPAAIELATKSFGGFDGLYHVAGGSGRSAGDGPLHEITDQGIELTLRHNLVSMMYSNRAAAQAFMARNAGGAVLNMGSVLGFSPAPAFFATHVYAAAKAAIIGLTRAAAAYYAPRDIRFNVLAPALVATPMSRRAQGDEQILRYIRARQPLDGGRIGQPEDCDAAAVYLLSQESRYVTGQVLAVDGGWSVSEGSAAP